MTDWEIVNATYIDAENIYPHFHCWIYEDKFSKERKGETQLTVDLHGRVIMPSFLNSFDNLLATYLPFKGKSFPYYTWLSWDNELKSSSLFEERMLLDRDDLYFLGSYKNIISGVTYVVDHIPHFVFEDLMESLDIELLQDFGIAHSPVSYSLNWGKGIKKEFEYAKKNHLPFIIRAGEGFDKENRLSIQKLEELEVLDSNTVLVHGICFNEKDIEIIKKYNCSFVWCPEVNEYIFGKTAPISSIISAGVRVCLGSGSSMNGSMNLLSTIKVAEKYISDPKMIIRMVTQNPVEAFFLEKRGKIQEDFFANFVILDVVSPDSLDFFTKIELETILLVVWRGKPIYGSMEFRELFHELKISYEMISIKKKKRLIKKGFTKKLNEIFFKLGKDVSFPFLPVEI